MCVEVVFLLLAHVYVRVMQPSNLQVKRVTWPYCARHSPTVRVMQQPTERQYQYPTSQRFVGREPTRGQLQVTRNVLRPELFAFVRYWLSTLNYSYISCSSQLRFNCVTITQNCPLKLPNVIHPLQTTGKIYVQCEVPFEKRNFRLPPRSRWKLRSPGLLRNE
jgi:hypothetical protein